MNTMTDLVTLNCRRLAVAWGYPDDLQTHWSPGYCQGDGVCYSGRITPPEIPRLVDGMTARDDWMSALPVFLNDWRPPTAWISR
ncbi:TPA: hypothetical protein ACNOC2_001464 [Salmonella enterica subsp. enterica serovar Enteritidis]